MLGKVVICLIILFFTMGCTQSVSVVDNVSEDVVESVSFDAYDNYHGNVGGYITTVHYKEKRVTCFIVSHYADGSGERSISCLPDGVIGR